MKKRPALVSFILGFSVIFLMALTGDQILQKVYDSSNTALRVNVVAGGGGGSITGSGFAGQGTYWTGASAIGGDAGFLYSAANNQITVGVFDTDHVGTAAIPSLSIGGKMGLFVDISDSQDSSLAISSPLEADDPVFNFFSFLDPGVDQESAMSFYPPAGDAAHDPLRINAQGLGGTSNTQFYAHSGAVYTDATAGLWFSATNATGLIRFAVAGNDPAANLVLTMSPSAITAKVPVIVTPIAVASLPTCNGGTEGARASVNDSNAVSFTVGIGAVVATGGTTHVPVYCDGTNWRIG